MPQFNSYLVRCIVNSPQMQTGHGSASESPFCFFSTLPFTPRHPKTDVSNVISQTHKLLRFHDQMSIVSILTPPFLHRIT
ncbi:hypothetical protein GLYMA_05G173750v4 [Glycine max]|nr:hypothetical protein GLYMA_05G173750v4 [Glycine max]KAH1134902.1 hypothetical protein GYH30_012965 [Glycine max]